MEFINHDVLEGGACFFKDKRCVFLLHQSVEQIGGFGQHEVVVFLLYVIDFAPDFIQQAQGIEMTETQVAAVDDDGQLGTLSFQSPKHFSCFFGASHFCGLVQICFFQPDVSVVYPF